MKTAENKENTEEAVDFDTSSFEDRCKAINYIIDSYKQNISNKDRKEEKKSIDAICGLVMNHPSDIDRFIDELLPQVAALSESEILYMMQGILEKQISNIRNAKNVNSVTDYCDQRLPAMQKALINLIQSPRFSQDKLKIRGAENIFCIIQKSSSDKDAFYNQLKKLYIEHYTKEEYTETLGLFMVDESIKTESLANIINFSQQIIALKGEDKFWKMVIELSGKDKKDQIVSMVKSDKNELIKILKGEIKWLCGYNDFDKVEQLLTHFCHQSIIHESLLVQYKTSLASEISRLFTCVSFPADDNQSKAKKNKNNSIDNAIKKDIEDLKKIVELGKQKEVAIKEKIIKFLNDYDNTVQSDKKVEQKPQKNNQKQIASTQKSSNEQQNKPQTNTLREQNDSKKKIANTLKSNNHSKAVDNLQPKSVIIKKEQEVVDNDEQGEFTQVGLKSNAKKPPPFSSSKENNDEIGKKVINVKQKKKTVQITSSIKTGELSEKGIKEGGVKILESESSNKISDQTDHEKVQKKTKEYTPLKVLNLCELARSYVEAQAREDKKASLNIALKIDNVSRGVVNINEPEFANGPTALDILSGGEIDQGYYYLRGVLTGLGAVENGYFDYDGHPFISLMQS